MSDWNSLLFLSCSLAGLIMVIGSLYLLLKGRIGLEKETKGVSKIKLPFFEVETPVAGLFLFVLGVFMVFIPIHYSPKLCPDLSFHKMTPLEMIALRGTVSSDTTIEVYAVVDEQKASAEQTIALSVPYLADRRYVVRYLDAKGDLVNEETFRLDKNNRIYELRGVRLNKGATADASPTPAIMLEQTESSNAVAEFTSR